MVCLTLSPFNRMHVWRRRCAAEERSPPPLSASADASPAAREREGTGYEPFETFSFPAPL